MTWLKEAAKCRQLYIQSTPNPSFDKAGLVVALWATLLSQEGAMRPIGYSDQRDLGTIWDHPKKGGG